MSANMNGNDDSQRPSGASWIMVAIAWTLVGVPLLWGILKTLEKAKALFG
jgi:hypothetical protein